MEERKRTAVTLVVVIPIGPRIPLDNIADTIDSVLHYTTPDRHIILMDDSSEGSGEALRARYPDVTVLKSPRTLGRLGGLYRNLSAAFAHADAHFEFKALLRLDTDALLVGPNPEADAIACFEEDPKVGAAGNYTHDYGGAERSRGWVKRQLQLQTLTPLILRRPLGGLALLLTLPRAMWNGYKLGEEVFGGATFYSPGGIRALAKQGFLPFGGLARTTLGEDEIFGIALRACGYHFADLWTRNQSFACTWNGLPATPEELRSGPAKVIHSVRDYKPVPEGPLRAFFREARRPVTTAAALVSSVVTALQVATAWLADLAAFSELALLA